MSDLTKAKGIAKLRELADALENNEQISMSVHWIKDFEKGTESMDFGNQLILDALAVHNFRVRIFTGAALQSDYQQTGTKQ